jgi:hypothetical protein
MNFDQQYLRILLTTFNFANVHLAALCIYNTHTLIMGHAVTKVVETLCY